MYLWAVPDGCLNILEWNFNWPCGCWPQSWPTPSLLEKFTRFSDVMISHTQSQAFFSQSLLFVFLSFFLVFVGVFFSHISHRKKIFALAFVRSSCTSSYVSVQWEFQTAKCLCLRRGIKGQRTTSASAIDLFSHSVAPWCTLFVGARRKRCARHL